MRDKDCSFCSELEGDTQNNFFLEYFKDIAKEKGFENRIVFETENFCVMPTVGPLVEGHLLVLPKYHCFSFSHISKCHFEKFDTVKERVGLLIEKVYHCKAVFFEHGSMSKTLKGGSTYDHAHIHVIPLSVDVKNRLGCHGFVSREIKGIEDFVNQAERGMPYLFFEDQLGNKIICDAPVVESQFIKKLIAAEIGSENISWKNDFNVELIMKSLEKLR